MQTTPSGEEVEELHRRLLESTERIRVQEVEIAALRNELQLRLSYNEHREQSFQADKQATDNLLEERRQRIAQLELLLQRFETLAARHEQDTEGLRDEIRHLEVFVHELPSTYGLTADRLLDALRARMTAPFRRRRSH